MKINWEMLKKLWRGVAFDTADNCWHWQGGKTGAGYGAFTINGRQYLAHRVSCAFRHGPPTKEAPFALHSCDTPSCCNPNHLRWGSQKANVGDAIERKRHSPPPRNAAYRRRDTQPKGAEVWNQSLTEDKVRAIWQMHLSGTFNVTQIADAVGAKNYTVADVVRGRSWRHLPDAPSIEALKAGGVRRGSNGFNELAQRRALEVRKAKR